MLLQFDILKELFFRQIRVLRLSVDGCSKLIINHEAIKRKELIDLSLFGIGLGLTVENVKLVCVSHSVHAFFYL